MTQALYSDESPDVFYEYGEYGERLWMQEKNSGGVEIARTDYGYDAYKRLQSETLRFNGLAGTFKVEYEYNYAGLPVTLKYTANDWVKQVKYAYSKAGALKNVGTDIIAGDPANNIASGPLYRGFGALKQMGYGNGQQLTAGYSHHRHHMTSLAVKKPGGADPVYDLSYDYYAGGASNGRLQRITDNVDPNFTTTYEYDDYNRLDKAYGVASYRDYDYDAWGNLTNVYATGPGEPGYSLSYEQLNGAPKDNRISNAGYDYDDAGNMTNDGGVSYAYDAASRLKTAGGNSYEYDGDGRRVRQIIGGSNVYYLWSSVLGQPVVELDGAGGVYRAYVYGGGGQLMALQANDYQFYWVHPDHLGSGRRLTNTGGAVIYRAEFDPHGQMLSEWASDGQMYKNSHKFTGYERDWATNLDNANARMLHFRRGRFMQPDPLGVGAADAANPQSLNRYSYVGNDPVNFVDPLGLMCFAKFMITTTYEDGRVVAKTWDFLGISCYGGGDGGYYQPIGGEVGGIVGGDSEAQDSGQPQQSQPQPCGVNPVTGQYGFTREPRGQMGNLRPGVGGRGEYNAPRPNNRTGRHGGLDIRGESGATMIRASREGRVTAATSSEDYGNWIEIAHGGGITTRYAHNFENYVGVGDHVLKGQMIGAVGQTGNARGQRPTQIRRQNAKIITGQEA